MRLTFLLALVVLLLGPLARADEQSIARQRAQFLRAESALRDGDQAVLHRLKEQLGDYPLYPYLEYEALRRRLDDATTVQVRDFFQAFADTPLAPDLRRAWLERLAKEGRWKTLLDDYKDDGDVVSRCRYLEARLHIDAEHAPWDEVQALWLVGRSQPEACDGVLRRWRSAGRQSTDLVWQRIALAMARGELRLVRYLSRFLDPADRSLAEAWRRMHRNPARELKRPLADSAKSRQILVHGLKRLARDTAETAWTQWSELRARHAFSERDRGEILRAIALHAAIQRSPDAPKLLGTVPAAAVDDTLQAWGVRSALQRADWTQVRGGIAALGAAERATDHWQYWQARSLERLGEVEEARKIYARLAEGRGYHNLLAADRMSLPYDLRSVPIRYSLSEMRRTESIPALRRARELLALGRSAEARREWHYALRDLDDRGLQLAAKLAQRWGWHDRAILTAAKSSRHDDLELRFPVLHRKSVLARSHAQGLDPAWVLGIMRQESAFMSDARSRSGALGLMQLMPRTGRETARRLRTSLHGVAELLDADKSILLGTAYLRRVLDLNDGHLALATAAYNAGPARVKRWRPTRGDMEADIWIETIPIAETRRYVRHVLAYTAIFEDRLGRKPNRLRQRLPEVPHEGKVDPGGDSHQNARRQSPGTALGGEWWTSLRPRQEAPK